MHAYSDSQICIEYTMSVRFYGCSGWLKREIESLLISILAVDFSAL
jgi:hypothetical protein